MAAAETSTLNYSLLFAFEANFDHVSKLEWMADNWTVCFWVSGCYLLAIFAASRYMQQRPGFRLRGALFVWNLSLALFSVLGACRVLPEMAASLSKFGFQHSMCDSGFFAETPGFWSWLFMLSKVPELGDTAFVILRKQPLHFLHWYHHVTVLCYSWYSYAGYTATGRWFIGMNYAVHAVMYSYYALKALRLRVPRQVSMAITVGQLAQMAVGCFVNVWGYRVKARGGQCRVTKENLQISLAMYLSYFALFVHFFYKSYVTKKPRPSKEASSKTE